MKGVPEKINNNLDTAEEKISELEYVAIKVIQNKNKNILIS